MIKSVAIFEKEIVVSWVSGPSSVLNLSALRKSCPCAWCSGEKDVFGNVYTGNSNNLKKDAFVILDYEKVCMQ